MKTITVLRLPFQIVEHPELQALLRIAQSAPFPLEFPSAKTVQRRIRDTVKESHKTIIQNLPPNAKLSIALDCWTSPFSQAFMAITGYFIDKDWNYREILLGFQPLQGAHSGANLSAVLLKIFQQHQIVDRVLAVTTDNASNNNTLITSIQESIQALELDEQITIIRIPCIAHVIQLSLNKLLGRIKANPKNQVVEREWSESRSQALRSSQRNKEIANTLEKVNHIPRRFAVALLIYYKDSWFSSFHQWKSTTPRCFLESSDRRTETGSDSRRTHSLELDVSNASTRKTIAADL